MRCGYTRRFHIFFDLVCARTPSYDLAFRLDYNEHYERMARAAAVADGAAEDDEDDAPAWRRSDGARVWSVHTLRGDGI